MHLHITNLISVTSQLHLKMAFKIPYLAIINISIFLISITLITLSAITIYWTDHAIRNWDFSYWTGYWYRGPWRDPETKHLVNLIYESLNENMIFASCGITIVAALAAIVGYFVTRVSFHTST